MKKTTGIGVVLAAMAVAGGVGATAAQAAPVPTAQQLAGGVPTGHVVLQPGSSNGTFGLLRMTAGVDSNHDLREGVTSKQAAPSTDPTFARQRFDIIALDGGSFAVCSLSVSTSTNNFPLLSCLDVANEQTTAGATIVLRPFDNSPSQRWRIQHSSAGGGLGLASFGLQNTFSGKFLDTVSDTGRPGALVQNNGSDTDDGQRWFIKTA
ncbi:RICIN domain-containing protein [Micromonospora auratinigra]|uniref:Uncharacterized protein n=1 Tax=Micromonospora auratinigra TaxID=261654 RepID=A0A1A8Z4V7_9ACTN|nr:RICIN domain-containing protein [Micromonospora auratinigra]SBT38813.1 hypothetical protein GA0070611_0683 [Micromonospora auratinigra]